MRFSGRVSPLVVILVIAGTLRLAWALYAARSVPDFLSSGDQHSYWYYANEISRGRGYVSLVTGEPTAYYPIGYPALLAGLFWLARSISFDDVALMTALLHVGLGVLTVWLVHLVARACWGPRVGLVAAAIMAVYPSAVFGVATFSLETAFVASMLGALALVVTHDWSTGAPSWQRSAAIGVVLALSVMVRPFSLPILAALGIALLVSTTGWRRGLQVLGIVTLTTALLLAPRTVRNAVRLDAFVPFSTNLGDTMCMARHPGSNGGFSWASHEWCADPTLPEAQRNTANIAAALHFIVENPREELLLIGKRFWLMMSSDRYTLAEVESNSAGPFLGGTTQRVLGGVADTWFFATLAAAVFGIRSAVRSRDRRPEIWATLAVGASLLAIPLALWGTPRFHAPLIPFIAMLAAVLTVDVADWWSARRAAARQVVVTDGRSALGLPPCWPLAVRWRTLRRATRPRRRT